MECYATQIMNVKHLMLDINGEYLFALELLKFKQVLLTNGGTHSWCGTCEGLLTEWAIELLNY